MLMPTCYHTLIGSQVHIDWPSAPPTYFTIWSQTEKKLIYNKPTKSHRLAPKLKSIQLPNRHCRYIREVNYFTESIGQKNQTNKQYLCQDHKFPYFLVLLLLKRGREMQILMCVISPLHDLAWIWVTGSQQDLLLNADDKSFIFSTGSFIVLAADHHEVLCRSCGREVKNPINDKSN